jgi:hypothetical protein
VGVVPGGSSAALKDLQYDFAQQYQVVEVSRSLLVNALALIHTHGLRAYDSLQLAAAVELHGLRTALSLPALTFVGADHELNVAASAGGLTVQDPNSHP